MLPVHYRPGFQLDAVEIFERYEQQSTGLGQRFLSVLKEKCDSIKNQPCSFSLIEGAVRVAPLHRFPYGVYFEVFDAELVIFAVLHLQREPSTWKSYRP